MYGVQLSQGYRPTRSRQFTSLPTSFPGVPGTHLIDQEKWTDELTLELLSAFKPGILGLGIQRLNH